MHKIIAHLSFILDMSTIKANMRSIDCSGSALLTPLTPPKITASTQNSKQCDYVIDDQLVFKGFSC